MTHCSETMDIYSHKLGTMSILMSINIKIKNHSLQLHIFSVFWNNEHINIASNYKIGTKTIITTYNKGNHCKHHKMYNIHHMINTIDLFDDLKQLKLT